MVGYVENLEHLNVSDLLSNMSLNSTLNPIGSSTSANIDSSQPSNESMRPGNVYPYECIDRFIEATEDSVAKIPNPVGYLQELCVKRRINLPEYGIFKEEGPSHSPTFSTYCQVNEHRRIVTSNSKKRGKELAAREMIRCLRETTVLEEKSEAHGEANDNNKTSETLSENTNATVTRAMNYIGFLQELCVKKGLQPPNYKLEKSEGTPNNPSFYMRCEVGTLFGTGIASNKKNAKQLAAQKVLDMVHVLETNTESFDKLITQAENSEILQTTTDTKCIEISDSALETLPTIPNPVGHLQELCVRNKLRPPTYGIVKVDGPPHSPTFLMYCKVDHFYQEASSSNKKKGKEMAASKILKCLMEYRSGSK